MLVSSRSSVEDTDELADTREVEVATMVRSAIPLVELLTAISPADVTTFLVASPNTELPDTRSPVPVAIMILSPVPETVLLVETREIELVTVRFATPVTTVPAQTTVPVPGSCLSGDVVTEESSATRLVLMLITFRVPEPDTALLVIPRTPAVTSSYLIT